LRSSHPPRLTHAGLTHADYGRVQIRLDAQERIKKSQAKQAEKTRGYSQKKIEIESKRKEDRIKFDLKQIKQETEEVIGKVNCKVKT